MARTRTEFEVGDLHMTGWKVWALVWLSFSAVVGMSAGLGAVVEGLLIQGSCGP
jgi:hypothetical protein